MEKKVFSYGTADTTALLNWTMWEGETAENFYKMANGYKMAAEAVVKDLLADNRDKRADTIAFPLLFLYEQSAELYMKSIILLLYRLDGVSDWKKVGKKINQHNQSRLLDRLFEIADKVEKGNDNRTILKPLRQYIDERLEYFDVNSSKQAFFVMRYPANTELRDYYYAKSYDNIPIDLVNLAKRFDTILSSLDELQWHYSLMIERQEEQNNP